MIFIEWKQYNIKNGLCMQTIAARAVNELWRERLFLMALTFHGGMQAIAWEWGAFNHPTNTESPDDQAQTDLASRVNDYIK